MYQCLGESWFSHLLWNRFALFDLDLVAVLAGDLLGHLLDHGMAHLAGHVTAVGL
jgi:hypothetical protein